MTEEIEQRGFEWYVDDADDADEIAEEEAARPENEEEKRLVSFLENCAEPDEKVIALWRRETQKDNVSVVLWRRYFHAGSAQLRKLILLGLDTHPCDQILLMQLAFLHASHASGNSGAVHTCLRRGDRFQEFFASGAEF